MLIDQVILKPKTLTLNKKEMGARNADSSKRSLVKTISWRVVGTTDTILISWLITGALSFAVSIGAVELVSKMVLYFFHERVWNNINYGK